VVLIYLHHLITPELRGTGKQSKAKRSKTKWLCVHFINAKLDFHIYMYEQQKANDDDDDDDDGRVWLRERERR